MSHYVIIPHIQVQAANMQTTGFLLGGAPLMAAGMFAHNLARQLNSQDEGFIYIHHQREELGGQSYGRFTPQQRRGAVFINKKDYSSKNKHALSLQPTASQHLSFSLIIRFASSPHKGTLNSILAHSRFAGGQILKHDDIETRKDLEKALEVVKTGFVLIDRQHWLQSYQQKFSIDRLQAFTQLLALKPSALEEIFAGYKNSSSFGWLAATNLGYALLEPENYQRSGVRQADSNSNDTNGDNSNSYQETPHAYAEPLVGLVQYVSLNEILQAYQQLDDPDSATQNWQDLYELIWTYQWLQEDVFVLQQNMTEDSVF